MTVAILILAAGGSARMGQPKQLLPFRESTLLGHVADAALEAGCGPVYVVLGADAKAIRESLGERDLIVVENPEWERGQGSSMIAGIAAIEERVPEADAVLVLLGDQPLIDAAIIRTFVARGEASPQSIVAAAYSGTTGVPALFPARLFDELKAIDPGKGAKPLLERHATELELVVLDENPDIDTPGEYRKLIR